MNVLRLALALAALLGFMVLSHVALLEHGYFGLWAHGFKDIGSTQIIVDLMIMSGFGLVWMVLDARQRAATVWPFVLITLGGGSVGPLSYLVVRELQSLRAAAVPGEAPPS